MTTMRQILKGSLRLINVVSANEEPSPDDMDISLAAMNGLIDSLGTDILNIFTFTPYRFMLTPGKQQYTLGPGGDWNTTRPMRIEQVKLMLYPIVTGTGTNQVITTNGSNTLFLPINMANDEEFSAITVRGLQNPWPTVMYDNGNYPLRQLSFWPIPTQAQAVELWLWDPLVDYDTLDNQLNLPPGYERYLRMKLAVEVAAEFGKTVQDTVMLALMEAEANIKRLNQQVTRTHASANGASLMPQGRGWNYITMIQGDAIPRIY